MAYRDPEVQRSRDRERYHQRTEARRAACLCLRCGKRPPEPGRTNCTSCAERNRKKERARNERLKAEGRPRRDPAKRKKTERERYRRTVDDRIARGRCPRCGKRPPAPERSTCDVCAEQIRAMARARYAKGKKKNLKYGGRPVESRRRAGRIRSERRRKAWVEAGLCTRCGVNPPAEDGGTTCTPCRTRRQAREREVYSRRRAEGLCVRCGVRTFEGASMCGPCTADEHDSGRIERKNARNRERYQERRSAGRCTDCQKPSHGASRCPSCAERSYARSSHFRGMPDWDPEHHVVDLVTGEEYGPFASEAEGAAHIAFLKLPAGRCEIISDVPLGLRYTGGTAREDTVR